VGTTPRIYILKNMSKLCPSKWSNRKLLSSTPSPRHYTISYSSSGLFNFSLTAANL
jgi:hypothetical protein